MARRFIGVDRTEDTALTVRCTRYAIVNTTRDGMRSFDCVGRFVRLSWNRLSRWSCNKLSLINSNAHLIVLCWHIVTSGRERGGCVSIGIVRVSNTDRRSFDGVGRLKRDSGGTFGGTVTYWFLERFVWLYWHPRQLLLLPTALTCMPINCRSIGSLCWLSFASCFGHRIAVGVFNWTILANKSKFPAKEKEREEERRE